MPPHLAGVTVWYAGAEPDETSMLMPADGALVVEPRAPGLTQVVFDDRVHGWEAVGEEFDAFGIVVRAEGGEWTELPQLELA